MAIASYSTENALAGAALETWKGATYTRPTNPASLNAHEAAFPPAHVADYRAGTVCRFKTTGPVTLAATLSASKPMSFVALVNHNLSDSAHINLHLASSLAGPWETVELGIYEGAFYYPFTLVSRRYIRLGISGSTVDGKPAQIGQVWFGVSTELPPFVWGLEQGEDVIDSYSESEYGVPHAHYLSRRRIFNGRFVPALQRNTVEDLETFRRQVQGRVRPFLFMPDPIRRYEVMLGRFTVPSWRRTAVPVATSGVADTRTRYAGVDFQFTEDPYGATGA